MMEKIMITAESFGSNCPQNWEEIADFLNEIIEEKIEADNLNDRDALDFSEELWEQYCMGNIKDAPEAVFLNEEEEKMSRTENIICNMVTADQDWFLIATDVKPGEEVADGYGRRRAPKEPGIYDLYQIAQDGQHVRFVWLNKE